MIDKEPKMTDEAKRAWELHIRTRFVGRDVISVAEVNDWWAERGFPNPLVKASTPLYHCAYDPMSRAGFRKLTRGDFVRANRSTLDQVPQCEPRQASNAEVQSCPKDPSPANNDRAMVQVLQDAVSLRSDFEDGEPRIADDDLARFLGYSRPEDIRRIIRNHSEQLGITATAAVIHQGAGRPGLRHFLTERQSLMVLRWADTPKADECYAHIIEVFLAWRAGRRLARSTPPAPIVPSGPDYLSAISEMHRTMSEGLERTVSTITATLVPLTSILDRLATKLLEPASAPAPAPAPAPSHATPAPPSSSTWPGYVRLDPADRVPSNHFSAQGYGSARGVTGRKRLKDLGRRAKEITVERGLDAFEKVTGNFPVRFWHVDALRAAYNEMIGARQ